MKPSKKHKHDWLVLQTKTMDYSVPSVSISGNFPASTQAFYVRNADNGGIVYKYYDVSKYICGTCKKVWEIK